MADQHEESTTSLEIPDSLVETLRSAERVVVLTGAGSSAESGVPTFRDAQTGLWEKYEPQELATPQAFLRDPKLVWEWYQWRRQLIAEAKPHTGHYALVAMEQHVPGFALITQNVDGMHQRAGNANVIELHGSIARTVRFEDKAVVEEWDESQIPPRCPHTGQLLRPDVVWFGEALPHDAFEAATSLSVTCDLFLSVGTSALVQPAASLPELARKLGTTVAIINPDVTYLAEEGYYRLPGKAGEVLPALVKRAWPTVSL